MGCLFAIFAAFFPRLALFMVWLVRPRVVDEAFDSWIWPLLGIIFLPFATLMYVLFFAFGGSLSGGEWFWVAIAACFDVASLVAGGFSRRR